MMIDCDTCVVRDLACGDCVVTVLLGCAPPAREDDHAVSGVDLDGREQAAIAVLAGAGLVPPLRLVSPPEPVPGGLVNGVLGESGDRPEKRRGARSA